MPGLSRRRRGSARSLWRVVMAAADRRRDDRRRDDRGAVATAVAVLLSGGVLLGFAAIVVDVGQIYVERAELQTGADAAAVAVAKACSTGARECSTRGRIETLARGYGNRNSGDGLARLAEVCGRLPGVLRSCSAEPANLTSCLGTIPAAPQTYVEVRLATRLPGNRFVLPPTFAQAMAGGADADGTSVGACARATWQSAATVNVIALTISTCELADSYDGSPPRLPYDEGDEYVIHFRAGRHPNCRTDPPGSYWSRPGPASFLRGTGGCELVLPADGRVRGALLAGPDLQPPAGCMSKLDSLRSSQRVVYLPVHDARHSSGSVREFRHTRVVPVVITGYSFGAEVAPSTVADDRRCAATTNQRCVSVVVIGDSVPLSNLAGSAIVRLVG